MILGKHSLDGVRDGPTVHCAIGKEDRGGGRIREGHLLGLCVGGKGVPGRRKGERERRVLSRCLEDLILEVLIFDV